ncbi:MAG TPA: sulfotransferase domain-containing protein [bacterium]|nr:sulfotransferase domain-containing protein [bacterium]
MSSPSVRDRNASENKVHKGEPSCGCCCCDATSSGTKTPRLVFRSPGIGTWQPRPLDHIRWNLTRKGRILRKADAIVVSVPKCGRTWLKVFLKAYFSAVENRDFSLLFHGSDRTMDVRFAHDLWEHLVRASLRQRLLGKHLVPASARCTSKILLLVRDPRDVIVSLYFHLTKRSRIFKGSLSEMIRHRRFGIESVIWMLNTWMKEWHDYDNIHIFRYEDFQTDPRSTFQSVLAFLGFPTIDVEKFAGALKTASFDSMREMEATGKADHKCLRPADAQDPDSFKVRRGIVGGYKDYLDEGDLSYIEEAMKLLDPRLGYTVESRS